MTILKFFRATAAAVASQAQAKQGKRRGVDYDYTY